MHFFIEPFVGDRLFQNFLFHSILLYARILQFVWLNSPLWATAFFEIFSHSSLLWFPKWFDSTCSLWLTRFFRIFFPFSLLWTRVFQLVWLNNPLWTIAFFGIFFYSTLRRARVSQMVWLDSPLWATAFCRIVFHSTLLFNSTILCRFLQNPLSFHSSLR